MQSNEEKAIRLLGFAARARRITVGVPLICAALQKGAAGKTPLLVLLASDASANTAKRIADRTAYYHVPLHALTVDGAQLALAVGKRDGTVAAVGITDPELAGAIAAQFA